MSAERPPTPDASEAAPAGAAAGGGRSTEAESAGAAAGGGRPTEAERAGAAAGGGHPGGAAPGDLPEPSRHLAPAARWVWRVYWAAGSVAVLVAGRAVDADAPLLDALLWALPLASLAIGTPVVPALRWRRWRWEVREHEIDLVRGVLVVRRTLIPMGRVQHVETERGVLEQSLGLATVEIHTAAGSHKIPLLSDYDAGTLRARIAELARTGDDDGRPAGDAPPDAGDLERPERVDG